MLEITPKVKWKVVRFDQMAVMVNDRIDNPSEANVDRYIGLEHLDSDSLTIRRWGSPSDVEATKLLFRSGDIIFGRRRAYQRKLAVADFDGICSAHAMVLRAKPEAALPEFLPFFMQSDLFMQRAKEISVGSLSPTINWKTLAKQEFALPSLEEQRRIVKSLSAADAAATSHQNAGRTASRLLVTTSHHLFSTLLCRESVPTRPLIELTRDGISNGIFRKREQFGSGLRLINVSDCYLGFLVPVERLKRVPVNAREYDSFSAKPGDVIFNRSSLVLSGIGHACLVPETDEKLVFESHLMRVRPKQKVLLGPFLARYALSPIGRRFLLSRAQTTTMTTIGQTDLGAMPVPYPDLETQQRIADYLDTIDKAITRTGTRGSEVKTIGSRLLQSFEMG